MKNKLILPLLYLASNFLLSIDIDNIQNQEDFNQLVAEKAVVYYNILNERGRYRDNINEDWRIGNNRWKFIKIKGGLYFMSRVPKDESVPSEDLRGILQSDSVMDCTTAIYIVIQLIILDCLGDGAFNHFYVKGEDTVKKSPGRRRYTIQDFSKIFLVEDREKFFNVTAPGFIGGFENLEIYEYIYPNGSCKNYNMISIHNNGKIGFIGFGKEFLNGPLSKIGIINKMLSEIPFVAYPGFNFNINSNKINRLGLSNAYNVFNDIQTSKKMYLSLIILKRAKLIFAYDMLKVY